MTTCGQRLWRWEFALLAPVFVGVLLLPGAPLRADEDKPQSAPADKLEIIMGPYLQWLTPDSVTIMWHISGGPAESLVEWGKSANELDKKMKSEQPVVHISGLNSGKTYYYRVAAIPKNGEPVESTVGTFTTPTVNVEKFTFAANGDTHQYGGAKRLADFMMKEKPSFWLELGDRNRLLNGFFKPYKEVLQNIPTFPVRGNHDPVEKQQQFFYVPDGPGKECYYSFTWGNVRIFVVDNNDYAGLKKGGAQYNWLENELKNSKETWKIVAHHQPIYSNYYGYKESWADELALIEQYGVRVVLSGHQHQYDRSLPVKDGKVDNERGVIHISASGACGGGEKIKHPEGFWFQGKVWQGDAFITMVTIDGNTAKFETMTPERQMIDVVELKARSAGIAVNSNNFELPAAVPAVAAKKIPVPSPQQYAWHEQERIMFVHLSPATWQGVEHDNLSTPLEQIALPKLDTDQWCETAKAWGAKEVLFVAKHSGGFCWWQTDTNKYGVKNAAWKNGKGDLLEDVAKSCRKYGLNIGVYLFPGDRSLGIGGGGRARDPAKQEAYNKIFRQQLRETLEIASKHAPLTEVWFDGSCAVEVGDVIRQYAPNAVVFQGPQASIRWVGNEAGQLEYAKSWCTLAQKDLATGVATARHSDPDGDAWAPLEVNTRLYARNWFWSPKNESTRKSLDELMRFYYASAGQGAVMLLNSTPNTDGLIPAGDVQLYRALGREIERRFGKPVKETAGQGETLELDFGRPTLVNHAVVMEDYRQGERIRRYVLEGFDGRQWNTLCEGAHVGRKRIDCFDEAAVSKLRLRVTESAGQPLIRSFQAFDVDNFRLAAGQPLRSPWKQCGSWKEADFKEGKARLDLNLTSHVSEAGQWEVLFQPIGSGAVGLKEEAMIEEGVPSVAGMIRRAPDRPNVLCLNRAASVTKESHIQVKVALEGQPCDGTIRIREVAH